MSQIVDLSRQCPLCLCADQHDPKCVLNGKEHRSRHGGPVQDPADVDWDATLKLHGIKR